GNHIEYHAKSIPYHHVPFEEQVKEANDILSQLSTEIKTRQKALNKLTLRLEDARSRKGSETRSQGTKVRAGNHKTTGSR
ncbi:MAG: hypothetical protein ABIH52_03050, partial [Candidatus Aenigmatarchaeota archaeon]